MTGFWLWAGLALVLALALLFRPFWFSSRDRIGASRQAINAAIYREQLFRLERDRAEDTLSEADYVAAHAELQRRVLEDTNLADTASHWQSPKRTVWLVGMLIPVMVMGLYWVVGNRAALDPVQMAVETNAQTLPNLERMVAGLAKKLENEPDNLEGWAMLARSYKMLGHNAEAEAAFERAGTFIEKDAQLLAIYADLAATNANSNFDGKPIALVEKALRLDPKNPMALWLYGLAAVQKKDFDTAIRTWENLLQQLEPQSEDWKMLKESIAAAYEAAGKKPKSP